MSRPAQRLLLLCAVGAGVAVSYAGQKPRSDVPGLPVPLPRPRGAAPPGGDMNRPRAIGAPDPSRMKPRAELVSIEKIWSEAPHNAFTDLIRFRERWYCAFREGSAHVSPDGALRVISSADGVHWSPAFYVSTEHADLRDPKLSVTPDRRLMLSAVAAYNPPAEFRHQSLAWYSLDGREWGIPFKIGDPDVWLWRVTWHRGSAYSMAYGTTEDRFLRMYVGPGGLRFQVVADRVPAEGRPSEATLLFNSDDSALCLLRRDGAAATAYLGYSRPPYRGWEWKDLGVRLGGPNMIRLPDGRIVAAGRLYDGRQRTSLCWLNEREATLSEFLSLPSGGDTSYPGLVYHERLLWVSYYSSHEGKAAIYLGKVRLPEPDEITDGKIRTAF